MIRDVNFFAVGVVAKGPTLGDVTLAIWTVWQAQRWQKTLLNLQGLLLHLPVNERCCWRYPCVPCHEASRQHLYLTLWPQRKMAAAVTDVSAVLGRKPWETCTVRGPGWIACDNCCDTCLPQCTSSSLWNKEAALSSTRQWKQQEKINVT